MQTEKEQNMDFGKMDKMSIGLQNNKKAKYKLKHSIIVNYLKNHPAEIIYYPILTFLDPNILIKIYI